jgi:SAM-dependent methyltransferase
VTAFDYLNRLRIEEITTVIGRHEGVFRDKDLLEIGAGTGAQLQRLSLLCRSAVGIDVAGCSYAQDRLAEIHEYDGQRFPFSGSSFDVVFSSNVLEHIKDETTVHNEIGRVLRPSGVAVHIVPTATWRLWSSMTHYLDSVKRIVPWPFADKPGQSGGNVGRKAEVPSRWWRLLSNRLVPPRHGEFGNRLTEHFLFRTASWQKRFERHGWRVESVEPVGLVYTGYSVLAGRLSMTSRRRLARLLGSSTALFILRRA